jgi:hypothetical protein
MLETEPQGLESDLTSNDCTVNEIVESFVESTTRLAESLDAPEERVDDFEESGKELASLVEETAHSVTNNSDRLDEVEDSATVEWDSSDHKDVEIVSTEGASFPIGRTISSKVSQTELDEVEEQLSTDDPNTNPNTTTDQNHAPESSLTPIEQLSEYDDVGEVTSSPSVERAVSLFKISMSGVVELRKYRFEPADIH